MLFWNHKKKKIKSPEQRWADDITNMSCETRRQRGKLPIPISLCSHSLTVIIKKYILKND